MNPDSLVSSFRADAAAPTAAARASARVRLHESITTAPPPREAARRRRRGRRLVISAAAVAAATAAALTTSVLDSDGANVLERAEAALDGPGRILHVLVTITDPTGTTREEAWVRTDGTRGRSVSRSGSSPSDCLGTRSQLRCYDAAANAVHVYTYNPEAVRNAARADLPGYRADDPESLATALRAGYARELGRTRFAGRDAYAIELAIPHIGADGAATPRFGGTSPILYVDPRTYLPVGQRFPDADSTTRYDTYEFLPDVAANAARLELPAPADAKVIEHPIGDGPSQ